jgi:hypothetical protein
MVAQGGKVSTGILAIFFACQPSARPGIRFGFVARSLWLRGLADFTVGPGWQHWCGWGLQGGGLWAADAGCGVATGSCACGFGAKSRARKRSGARMPLARAFRPKARSHDPITPPWRRWHVGQTNLVVYVVWLILTFAACLVHCHFLVLTLGLIGEVMTSKGWVLAFRLLQSSPSAKALYRRVRPRVSKRDLGINCHSTVNSQFHTTHISRSHP